MSGFEIVALAASAGGLQALTEVLAALPRDFPAALVVVQHLDPRHRSQMAEILGKRTALLVRQAREGDALEHGVAFIAPPNLPRSGGVGLPRARGGAGDARAQGARQPGARLVGGLRRRAGGLHHRHAARRGDGLGGVPRARQGLRHRRRRGGARPGAAARLWDAVRASDESVFLLDRLGEEFAKAGNTAAAEKCFDEAREAHARLRPVRGAAIGSKPLNVQKLREKAAAG